MNKLFCFIAILFFAFTGHAEGTDVNQQLEVGKQVYNMVGGNRQVLERIGGQYGGTNTNNILGSFDSYKNSLSGITNSVGGATGAVNGAVGGVTGAIGGATGAVTGAVGNVTGAVGGIANGVTGAANGVTGAANNITGAVSNYAQAGSNIAGQYGMTQGNMDQLVGMMNSPDMSSISQYTGQFTDALDMNRFMQNPQAQQYMQTVTNLTNSINKYTNYIAGLPAKGMEYAQKGIDMGVGKVQEFIAPAMEYYNQAMGYYQMAMGLIQQIQNLPKDLQQKIMAKLQEQLNKLKQAGDPTTAVANALGFGASNGQVKATEPTDKSRMSGLTPQRWPDDYCDGTDCANLVPVCEDYISGKTSAVQSSTKYTVGDCITRASRLAMGTQYRLIGTIKNDNNNISVTPGDYASNQRDFYTSSMSFASQYITNWKYNGDLAKKVDTGHNASGDEVPDTAMESLSAGEMYDSSGKPVYTYSNQYKDDTAMVSKGACQMIANGNGKYNVTPMGDGQYQVNEGAGDGTLRVSVERINNPQHPFAPRDNFDWTEKKGKELSEQNKCSDQIPEKVFTELCGTMDLLGQKAWQMPGGDMGGYMNQVMGAGGSSGGNAIGGFVQDLTANYEYYKIPIEDKKAKILSTQHRKQKYDNIGKGIYLTCEKIMEATGVGAAAAPQVCCPLSQYMSCRINILPPEVPDNALKMSYGLFENKDDKGGKAGGAGGKDGGTKKGYGDTKFDSGNTSGAGGMSTFKVPDMGFGSSTSKKDGLYGGENNKNLPRIFDSPWPSVLGNSSKIGITNNGYSFYNSVNIQNQSDAPFGFNMPVMKHWPTGDAGSIPLVQNFTDRTKWEPWRQVISGVNREFKPDESNPSETGAYSMSCQFGGWNELVLYQARCQQLFGLNCICDYFENFYRGSSLGYVLWRSGAPTKSITSETIRTQELKKYDGQVRAKSVDETPRPDVEWKKYFKKGEYRFPVMIGHEISQNADGSELGKPWPGEGAWNIAGGLSSAQKDDIIFFEGETTLSGSKMRPWHAAYVEQTNVTMNGNNCILVSESNNGVLRDSCESTENWGKVSQRYLCQNATSVSNFKGSNLQGGGLKSCIYPDEKYCHEKDWAAWKIYRYALDSRANPKPKSGSK